jgi:hypothetical protein
MPMSSRLRRAFGRRVERNLPLTTGSTAPTGERSRTRSAQSSKRRSSRPWLKGPQASQARTAARRRSAPSSRPRPGRAYWTRSCASCFAGEVPSGAEVTVVYAALAATRIGVQRPRGDRGVESADGCKVIAVPELPTGAGALTRVARVPMVGPVAGWLEGHAQHSNLRHGEGRRVSIMIHVTETDTRDIS